MERNSTVNQTIKGKFVGNEVFANVGLMVEYILNKSYEDTETPFSWEDVTNLYKDNSDEIDEKQEEIDNITESERYCELDKKYFDDELTEEEDGEYSDLNEQIDSLQNNIDELTTEQEEQQEVFEWWKVSSYLANKLEKQGEVIIQGENIWGRCTTGQAILLDSVISDICENMEILEGQKYSWEDK